MSKFHFFCIDLLQVMNNEFCMSTESVKDSDYHTIRNPSANINARIKFIEDTVLCLMGSWICYYELKNHRSTITANIYYRQHDRIKEAIHRIFFFCVKEKKCFFLCKTNPRKNDNLFLDFIWRQHRNTKSKAWSMKKRNRSLYSLCGVCQ